MAVGWRWRCRCFWPAEAGVGTNADDDEAQIIFLEPEPDLFHRSPGRSFWNSHRARRRQGNRWRLRCRSLHPSRMGRAARRRVTRRVASTCDMRHLCAGRFLTTSSCMDGCAGFTHLGEAVQAVTMKMRHRRLLSAGGPIICRVGIHDHFWGNRGGL